MVTFFSLRIAPFPYLYLTQHIKHASILAFFKPYFIKALSTIAQKKKDARQYVMGLTSKRTDIANTVPNHC